MSLRESGDPLSKLVEALDDFAERAPARMLKGMTRAGDSLIREGFDRSRAPDGTAWAPLARAPSKKRPGRRPLVRTGNARAWASAGVIVSDTTTWSMPRYMRVHQTGTRPTTVPAIPARPFLPPGVLPTHWHARLSYAADRALPQLPPDWIQ